MIKKIKQYSTYARSIVSDIKTLAVLIRKYSFKEKSEGVGALPGLLAQSQIEQALLNPQSSLQLAMSTAAEVIKMHRGVLTAREQAEAQRRLIKESVEKIEERENSSTINPVQKEQLAESLRSLRIVQKQIVEQIKELNELSDKLQPLRENIDKITLQCNQDWETYRTFYLNKLLSGIEAEGIALTEQEKKELLQQETWQEIVHRFEVLNLETPKYLSVEDPTFASYFRMKGYLTVHAALGRQMQFNKPEDIIKILKPLLKG